MWHLRLERISLGLELEKSKPVCTEKSKYELLELILKLEVPPERRTSGRASLSPTRRLTEQWRGTGGVGGAGRGRPRAAALEQFPTLRGAPEAPRWTFLEFFGANCFRFFQLELLCYSFEPNPPHKNATQLQKKMLHESGNNVPAREFQ